MSNLGISFDDITLLGDVNGSGAIGEESQTLNLLPSRQTVELPENGEFSQAGNLNNLLLQQPISDLNFESNTGSPIQETTPEFATLEPIASQSNSPVAETSDRAIRFNFQPEAAPVPTGYTPDFGEAFDATQGYGWVSAESLDEPSPTPIDITPNARDRHTVEDQRLDTLLHMHYSPDSRNRTAMKTPAAWEYALPDGIYNVTIGVGDPVFNDSLHAINVEGVAVFPAFEPTSIQPFDLGVATVEITDGRLSVEAIDGTNTKINYIEIESASPGDRPSISGSDPARRETEVSQDAGIALDVVLVNVGAGVDASTLTTENVQLYRTEDNTLVPGNINTTGGGDTVVYTPTNDLEPFENYTFRLSSGVRDQFGNSFLPFATTFSTGDENQDPLDWNSSPVFSGAPISSLTISPDGSQLYATALDGLLRRWTIGRSGELTELQTFDGLTEDSSSPRAITGIVFDPDDPNVLWVSHNDTLFVEPALDFTGKISKLTLQSDSDFNPTVEDYVTNLPRSAKNHLSNSLAFGPDGNLYLSQGSNSAMGAPDDTWYQRPERLLTAAILQIDPDLMPPTGGFNVQTKDYTSQDPDASGETVTTVGDYNPFAPDAPVTIYSTGVRNAFDLVWHSNGSLYAPTNGSAAGGNTPDDPDTLSTDEELLNGPTQNDYLFRVEQGGYYGHPNPLREEYILNGGNPNSEEDPAEIVSTDANGGYTAGVEPTWKGFAYDFGRNRSPNGAIEYQSNTFDGILQNALLVVEFSGGDDILALTPDPAADGDIPPNSAMLVAENLVNPLDLVEDPLTGNLYVAELINEQTGAGRITRFVPNT